MSETRDTSWGKTVLCAVAGHDLSRKQLKCLVQGDAKEQEKAALSNPPLREEAVEEQHKQVLRKRQYF